MSFEILPREIKAMIISFLDYFDLEKIIFQGIDWIQVYTFRYNTYRLIYSQKSYMMGIGQEDMRDIQFKYYGGIRIPNSILRAGGPVFRKHCKEIYGYEYRPHYKQGIVETSNSYLREYYESDPLDVPNECAVFW
jgi:hypothetical protein